MRTPPQVRVHRVTGMPCGVAVWVDDRPDRVAIYIDAEEITERGARLLQRALNANARQGHWRRQISQLVAAN